MMRRFLSGSSGGRAGSRRLCSSCNGKTNEIRLGQHQALVFGTLQLPTPFSRRSNRWFVPATRFLMRSATPKFIHVLPNTCFSAFVQTVNPDRSNYRSVRHGTCPCSCYGHNLPRIGVTPVKYECSVPGPKNPGRRIGLL